MGDKMIIDFINNVEPNISYGTSDGMARAMIESAENMALINDYIAESTYEAYSESIISQNTKDRFTKFYAAFIYTIKKAIEKVKGFFLSIKRKLTMAMAKALKILGKKIVVNKDKDVQDARKDVTKKYFNNAKVYGGDTNIKELNTYAFDTKKYNELCDFINSSMSTLSDIKSSLNNGHTKIKEDFDKFVNGKNDTGSVLLTKTVYKIRLGVSDNKYLEKKIKEIFKDVDTIMNEFYNRIMKSFDNSISELKKAENETKDMVLPTVIKTRYKAISSAIHIANYIKYKSSQLVASACLKMYKKSFSEAMKMNTKTEFFTLTDKDGNPAEPIDPEKEKERLRKYKEKSRIEDERRELELIKKRKAIKDKLKASKDGNIWLDGLYDDSDGSHNPDPDTQFERFKNKIKDRIKIDKNDTIESIKRKLDQAGKDDVIEF
jgi:hypothetical protein|nr:MAG TPA: hypothetical protein [Caudoviricetes sp.]